MKIKLKEYTSTYHTLQSPYYNEIGPHTTKYTTAYCGNCNESIEQARFYQSWNYCPYCGEKIDWPENERRK